MTVECGDEVVPFG
jgi:hypothetical protein